jgi:hypothetical protein
MPIPAYFNAFLITCGLQRQSVLNKHRCRLISCSSAVLDSRHYPGIAAGAIIYWRPIPGVRDRQIRVVTSLRSLFPVRFLGLGDQYKIGLQLESLKVLR